MHWGMQVAAGALLLTMTGCASEAVSRPSKPASEATSTTAAPSGMGDMHEGDATDPDRPTIVDFHGDERRQLADQLVAVRELAMRYPTVADAE
ncbi:MAG: hypothetical protein ACTHN0_16450, partial [Aquihabitans sp.]